MIAPRTRVETFTEMICGPRPKRADDRRVDIQTGRLYDCISFAPSQIIDPSIGNSQWFTNVEHNSGKSLADTNLDQNGRLCAPESFLIDERIVLSFSSTTSDRDVFGIAENFCFEFWIGKKSYIRAPIISMRPHTGKAPIWVCGYCATVYANQANCPNCGAGSTRIYTRDGEEVFLGKQFVLDVDPALLIANQMSFFAQLQGYRFTVVGQTRIWCSLEGLHARGLS